MDTVSYFRKDPRLETERLLLRKLAPKDAADMYEYSCRPETSEYLLWSPHTHLSFTADLIRYLQNEYEIGRYFDFAVIYKENMKMIGTAGLTSIDEKNSSCEVGYVLNPDYWNKGIATEALQAVMNFAFCELNFNRVEAKYMAGNEASRHVMEKCGMTHEGIQRSKLFVKGKFRDIGVCAILRSEYLATERENLYKKCNRPGFLERLFHKN